MALSDENKSKVRKYLGVTGKFPNVDSRLEQAMDQVGLNAEDELRVIESIVQCDAVDVAIQGLVGACSKVIAVDGIKMRSAYGLGTLRSIGKQYAGSISDILGAPLVDGGFFSPTGARVYPGHFGSDDYPPLPSGGGNWPKYG